MKKISISLLSAGLGLAVLVIGGTGAFFSDTETSTGNTFTAGAIDLKVDNDSYYNGNRCVNIGTEEQPNFVWQGSALFPVPGTPCNTSFPESDLDRGLVFFDFDDVKPDDEGEDTISLHVQNDAWACMDLTLTSNDDVSTTEPESEVDAPNAPDQWDGELAQNLQFFWWADDGDNVYEEGENQISEGVQTLLNLAPQDDSFSIALADSNGNAWGGTDPLPANETVYIAKAWCYGTLTTPGLPDDADTGPQARPGSVLCDGAALGNETQTDSAELTLAFRAEQARHNEDFLCNPDQEPETGTLTVNKALLVSTAGIEVADFELHIDGPQPGPIDDQVVTDEIPMANLPTGPYTVYEVITGDVSGKTFTVSFSGACTDVDNDDVGELTLNANDNLTCNILNNEVGDGIGD